MKKENKQHPIPDGLNMVIFFFVLLLDWFFLWLASHASWWVAIAAAVGFAFFHNTIFALLHEAVHGVFSPNKTINDLFGHLSAAVFPTSYTLHTIAHTGHHERNRTDVEMFDYYLPHESKARKNILLYAGNLMGLYWFCIPFVLLLMLVAPHFVLSDWFIKHPAKALGFEPFLNEIAEVPKTRLWLEAFLAFFYQTLIWFALDLNWQGWLLTHWFFALHWSALQYVNHAWTPRDIVMGAWNLTVHPAVRLIALNYHCHLAHHRFPLVPWIYLPEYVDEDEVRPTFWKIYFSLWKNGVQPAPPMREKV